MDKYVLKPEKILIRGKVEINKSLVIEKGKILSIEEGEVKGNQNLKLINLDNQILLPGLINSHTHLAMTFFRGLGEGLQLKEWLEQEIWPLEEEFLSEEFVYESSLLAMTELIENGITTFVDMYNFPGETLNAAKKFGLRGQYSFNIIDFPTPWAKSPDEYISKGIKVKVENQGNELTTFAYGPHAPYTISDDTFLKIKKSMQDHDLGIQIHLHETAEEISNQDIRPLERIHKLGLINEKSQLVHMTQISEGDKEILKESGASIIHCPESNCKLGSGICPIQELLNDGINVALGTDGVCSNNDLSLFGEMKTASFLSRILNLQSKWPLPLELLNMATINGAKSMRIPTGEIAIGKPADLCAFPINHTASLPQFDPLSNLIYSSTPKASFLAVAGKIIMEDSKIQTDVNVHKLATKWEEKIRVFKKAN